jgi:hypothetical protein
VPYVEEHEKYVQTCRNTIKSNGGIWHGIADLSRVGQVPLINLMIKRIGPDPKSYITFMGADDFMIQDRLQYVAEFIEDYQNPAWVYGGHVQRHDNNYIEEKRIWPRPWDYGVLKSKNYIAGGAVFVRADIYWEIGYLRDLWGKQGADWDMWMRLGEKYTPLVYNGFVYVERLNTSTIRNKNTKLFNRIKYPIWRIQRGYRKVERPYY